MEKRKRGRPEIPQNIQEYCITAAMKYPNMPRKELVAKVERELQEKGLKPPGKDKMLKLFQQAPDKTDEDKPWSIGKSVQYGLSTEATSDLLRLQRFCLAAGLEFTVRQAKWGCYLHNQIRKLDRTNKLDPSILHQMCQDYSYREKICESLNIDLDTTDLDIPIIMPPPEYSTAKQAGIVREIVRNTIMIGEDDLDIMKPKQVWGRSAAGIVADEIGIGAANLPIFNLNLGDDKTGEKVETINNIYAYWLKSISHGPKWGNMEIQDQQQIVKRLFDAISIQVQEKNFEWLPVELLEEVGYEEVCLEVD